MRAMLLAFLAIIVISAGAKLGLRYAGFSTAEQASGVSVRLD